jgi:hypothetical protein
MERFQVLKFFMPVSRGTTLRMPETELESLADILTAELEVEASRGEAEACSGRVGVESSRGEAGGEGEVRERICWLGGEEVVPASSS